MLADGGSRKSGNQWLKQDEKRRLAEERNEYHEGVPVITAIVGHTSIHTMQIQVSRS